MKKLLLLVLALSSTIIFAQHTTTGASSDWSNTAAWTQGTVPTESDNVEISHAITVTASDAVCNNLTVHFNGGAGSLTISGNDGTTYPLVVFRVLQIMSLHIYACVCVCVCLCVCWMGE